MNQWYRDPRFRIAEAKSFEADRAGHRHQPELARRLHHEAAEGLAILALEVPAEYPHTRSDFAIAAAASYACAGEHDGAVRFARRMLEQPEALSQRGRGELALMVTEYEAETIRDEVDTPTELEG